MSQQKNDKAISVKKQIINYISDENLKLEESTKAKAKSIFSIIAKYASKEDLYHLIEVLKIYPRDTQITVIDGLHDIEESGNTFIKRSSQLIDIGANLAKIGVISALLEVGIILTAGIFGIILFTNPITVIVTAILLTILAAGTVLYLTGAIMSEFKGKKEAEKIINESKDKYPAFFKNGKNLNIQNEGPKESEDNKDALHKWIFGNNNN